MYTTIWQFADEINTHKSITKTVPHQPLSLSPHTARNRIKKSFDARAEDPENKI